MSGGAERRVALLTVSAVVTAVSLGAWLWRRRRRRLPQQLRPLPDKTLLVVDSAEQWADCGRLIRARCSEVAVLGLDCEWVTVGSSRRPVALLQLATLDGLCVLVRLCSIPDMPEDLKCLLRDRSVLKVGVACLEDGQLLLTERGVPVRGCVDLRHLAGRHPDKARLLRRPGLAALADLLLGVQLSKGRRLRCSDWEADELTSVQQEYAANDALVGALLFRALLKPKVPELTRQTWPRVLSACQGLVDCKYKPSHTALTAPPQSTSAPSPSRGGGARSSPTTYQQGKQVTAGYQLRKSQLYDNARLLAPDGQPLSVVENSKARWYVYKGLGDVVEEEPFTVRLKFEPAGRPQLEGTHGHYYLQEKDNCCVRCGASDGYVKKNIVPQEYRKHFPEIMKSHQSHDVLLLCVSCHQESNCLDLKMRQQLAEECHAPIGTESDIKVREDQALRKVKSAGRALQKSRDRLPAGRLAELEAVLCDYYGVSAVTDHVLADAANMCTNRPNSEYMSHGEAVYRHFCQPGRGLIRLELRWRQHFLDSMRPARLPALWSVDHNHAKIRWKIRRADWPRRVRDDIWRRCVGTEYTEEGDDGPEWWPPPMDGITADPAPVDGNTTDPAPVDGSTTDPAPVDGNTADPAPVDGSTADPAPVDGNTADPAPVDGNTADPAPVDGSTTDPAPVDGITADPAPVDGNTADPAPVDGNTADPAPVDGNTADPAPVDGNTTDPAPVDGITADPAPVDGNTADPAPVDGNTADPAPVDGNTADPAPVDGNTADPAPVDGNTADPAPVDGNTADPAPVDGSTADPAPVDGNTADPAPVDGNTADPAPVDGNTADPAPVDGSTTD